MAVGCGPQCAKILLIVFNIIFWLSGAALLGLGIWMFVDDNISNYIKVFAAFEDGGAFIKYAAIVFICVGCFVLLVGFLGCCGAIKESRCMLGMYIAFLVVIMAAEIAAAVIVLVFKDQYMFFLVIIMAAEIAAAVFILIFRNKYIACLVIVMVTEIAGAVLALLFRNKILDDMETEMVKLIKEHYGRKNDDTSEAFTEGLDYVQEELKCCGVTEDAEADYTGSPYWIDNNERLPDSCCKGVVGSTGNCPTDFYNEGCSQKIKDFVEDNSIILMVVGFCIAGIEIFGFIFAVCLCRNVGEED